MTYTATIRHHSISSARTVSAPTLAGIKRKATREFGDEFLDYTIAVYEDHGDGLHDENLVCARRVGDSKWSDCTWRAFL